MAIQQVNQIAIQQANQMAIQQVNQIAIQQANHYAPCNQHVERDPAFTFSKGGILVKK
ncbi:hypothetical protein [Pedobacter lusitanus]|uniref:hypothetical protein n=1 Tax=Pedobacter lusitanus TaxID=1503925 RepID=UPI001364A4A0|nr:hypothetical protein [Pedobacter lusitanus]